LSIYAEFSCFSIPAYVNEMSPKLSPGYTDERFNFKISYALQKLRNTFTPRPHITCSTANSVDSESDKSELNDTMSAQLIVEARPLRRKKAKKRTH